MSKELTNNDKPWLEHSLTESEYERILELMGRKPNYLELAIFGVMWSEHCGYKNSKAQLKKFPTQAPWVLQGPGENAGVIDLGHNMACCFKMESHNHPSAIEPYQGAATGVGGIIRDIFAMGARPIASLDSLRFGDLEDQKVKRLIHGVVAGIGGYGNCMGIPTVGGEVFFHPAFNGNPLVNAMCVGLMDSRRIFKGRAAGLDNVVMLVGARTGRDGIKGASFASEELSDNDADKRPNVQVGDPFMEKLLMEATLEILEANLAVGLQDLGAAGLTSSGAEMASRAGNGLYIDLNLVPLREDGLKDWEIMLSESQERMLLVVEPDKVSLVQAVFDKWDLPAVAVGQVTSDGLFSVRKGEEVLASIEAKFLTEMTPIYYRESLEPPYYNALKGAQEPDFSSIDPSQFIFRLLSSPNLCSRRWIYEQYDYMVRIDTIIRPGGDAALLRLPFGRGLALSCDCLSRYVYLDPYLGGAWAAAEAALNVAVTGARPLGLTNCLNFGAPENPHIYWQFVKATDGLAEVARELQTPVTGGNVSFYNEYDGRPIYPTITVGMVGLIDDYRKALTHYFKKAGDLVLLIGALPPRFGAGEARYILTGRDEGPVADLDLKLVKRTIDFLVEAVSAGLLSSAHDVSDGGLAVALCECLFENLLGLEAQFTGQAPFWTALFAEGAAMVIVSLPPERLEAVEFLLVRYELSW
ncbi:MAG: phosphoribosylformylglycinamidine synthase subunit PurL, partial [Deltaproteobacteria bacterium]|nr:phosphoribosylformylglycinamidine synthase subunit PurL [Deltaproteobacteria bacterium]